MAVVVSGVVWRADWATVGYAAIGVILVLWAYVHLLAVSDRMV